jgi:hypothetical protein
MDHHGGGLRCDHGIDRIALVLDPEALRLQTRTTDHRTVETMIENIVEVHRPLPTNVSNRTIIGAFRNLLAKSGTTRRGASARRFVAVFVPEPTQSQYQHNIRSVEGTETY